MENLISFEEALARAKRFDEEYNVAIEYTDAWGFKVDDGVFRVGGGGSMLIILKTGKTIMTAEYFLTGKYDCTVVRDNIRI